MQVNDLGMGVLEVVPREFGDARGYFAGTFQRERFREAGLTQDWMQDNQPLPAE